MLEEYICSFLVICSDNASWLIVKRKKNKNTFFTDEVSIVVVLQMYNRKENYDFWNP